MKPVSERRWRVSEPDPAHVARLVRENGLTTLVAGILVTRGIEEPAAAGRFLSASLADIYDPFLLLGMERAVERLARAVKAGERVCVYGDYDVDGITSVALLIDFFRTIGLDCFYHIPHRLEEGYGLSAEGLEKASAHGATVVITVDCGITAYDEAALCGEMGIDLIITDHHTPGERIPSAYAVINPHQPGCPFPFKHLAGVGVAFNLLIALRGRLRSAGFFATGEEPNLRGYLDLVALGTIADIVPLTDENRIFVKFGLRELTSSTRPGIHALKTVAGVSGEVNCGAVGFRLAPRLNAAGRLEDAARGVALLLCEDQQQAMRIAEELDASNSERQALEQQILRDALEMVTGKPSWAGKKSIVLASKAWHPGVIGIVASRMVDLFHRPTILIALQDGNGRGSGRSIPRFHLHDALHACSEHLLKFGGHKYAAGLSIDQSTLENFMERFEEIAGGLLAPEDLTPELAVDAELAPGEITLGLAEAVGDLAPFGMGNPEPVFLLRRADVVGSSILKERHLKLKVKAQGMAFDAIGFGLAGKEIDAGRVDLAFCVSKSTWNGKTSLQLRLKDLREAET